MCMCLLVHAFFQVNVDLPMRVYFLCINVPVDTTNLILL
jgi:hypothetical protein